MEVTTTIYMPHGTGVATIYDADDRVINTRPVTYDAARVHPPAVPPRPDLFDASRFRWVPQSW